MIKRNNITIKRMLIASGVLTTFILFFSAFLTNVFIRNTAGQYNLVARLADIERYELKIRKAEKDLLIYETINEDYFLTGQSNYITSIGHDLLAIQEQLTLLKSHPTIEQKGFGTDLEKISELVNTYQLQINKLASLIKEKGFKDYGLEGEMRQRIHTVENEIKKVNNNRYEVRMLTLRRHEKDYLLRKDLKYREKFDTELNSFIKEIQADATAYHYLIPILNNYRESFFKLIAIDTQIGIDHSSGLLNEINTGITEIEKMLGTVSASIETASHKNINRTIFKLFTIILLFSAIIVLILFRTSTHIVKSISNLRHHITRLGHGELPDEIPIYNNDEIAHMKASINELTKNLKNTRQFAESVGNGNFEQEIDVFGNEGDLGSALVEMRNKLLQISKERVEQIKESEMRLWANDGFNQIHQILSGAETTNEAFYYMVVSKLVKYLTAA